MRVTQNMIAESFMRNMYQNLSRLGEKNDQISSQKRIRRPSDDPVGAALAVRLRRQLAAMDQYKNNAEDVITWLKDTEAALTNTGDILHRLKDLTIQAANDTLTKDERQTILHEVQELKDQLLQEANSTHVDRYLFSGYHVDKQPFIKGNDGRIKTNEEIKNSNDVRIIGVKGKAITDKSQFVIDEIEGLEPGKYKLEIVSIDNDKLKINFYRQKTKEEMKDKDTDLWADLITIEDGNSIKIEGKFNENADFTLTLQLNQNTRIAVDGTVIFEITPGDIDYHLGRNDLMPVNLQGPEIFEKIFDSVQDLEDALKDQNSELDLSDDVLRNIKDSLSHVLKYRSQVGARSKRLEMTVNKMESSCIDYKDLLSKTEDLDLAKAATELKMEESVYRAALAVGARIIQPNLADFLR